MTNSMNKMGQMIAVLEAMHQAIRTARFESLADSSVELEAILSSFLSAPDPDPADGLALARLRRIAASNAVCLEASAQGLRAGRRRLVEIAGAARTDTYDRSGTRRALPSEVAGRRL